MAHDDQITGNSLRSWICERERRAMKRPAIANAIIWAALILATALVLTSYDAGEVFPVLLTVVFVPLWFASDQIIRRIQAPSS